MKHKGCFNLFRLLCTIKSFVKTGKKLSKSEINHAHLVKSLDKKVHRFSKVVGFLLPEIQNISKVDDFFYWISRYFSFGSPWMSIYLNWTTNQTDKILTGFCPGKVPIMYKTIISLREKPYEFDYSFGKNRKNHRSINQLKSVYFINIMLICLIISGLMVGYYWRSEIVLFIFGIRVYISWKKMKRKKIYYEVLSFRLTTEERTQIEEILKRRNCTKSKFLRNGVRTILNNHSN